MKIAAFNIRRLGWYKVSNKSVLRYLIKIVSRYSVVLILEVVDKEGRAMKRFLQKLNNTRANRRHPYSVSTSCRLGRNSYKEQFVFLYREDEVQLTGSYQYEDNQVGDEDAFAREPYILRFSCLNTALKDLVLVPVHTKPEDSDKELDELHDVISIVRTKWKTDALRISDHYPVEVELKRKGPRMGASQATKVPQGPTKKKLVSGVEKCAAKPTNKRAVLQKNTSVSEEPQKKKMKPETQIGTQKKRNATLPPEKKRAHYPSTARRAAKKIKE